MLIRTAFSSCGEGCSESGPRNMPVMLRTICTGVNINPHGNPHQPSNRDIPVSISWALVPHERQEIWGVLLHEVITSADITR
jgi:hypothetical protein